MFTTNYIQIAEILLLILMGFAIFKIKPIKYKLIIAAASILLILFAPMKFKQDNISKLEKRFSSNIELSEKVVVNKNMSEELKNEYKTLKDESKEIENEIN